MSRSLKSDAGAAGLRPIWLDAYPRGKSLPQKCEVKAPLSLLKKNHSQQLYPNLTFLDQDFLKTDFVNKFDLAVAFSSMHWYKNQDEILKKVYQALKPGGRLLFTIPGKPLQGINACLELVDMDEWKGYFEGYVHPRKHFTPEEYRSLLDRTGFKSIEITVNRRQHFFENKRALIDWFKAFSPLLDRIPDAKRDNFLTDFANLYTQYFPIEPDGRIPFVQDELFVRAVKP